MCLAILARHAHPRWPLVIVANRDEFHERPARAAHIWSDAPQVLGGRDLQAGGTWLGINRDGRIGLLTNYREPGKLDPNAPSRGALVENYLTSDDDARTYASMLGQDASHYNGFNLLLIDPEHTLYFTNRQQPDCAELKDGVYGLSNATLDTPWPKLLRTQQSIVHYLSESAELNAEDLFRIFRDTQPAPDADLPHTGLSPERERLLSSPFTLSQDYGTRCTTLILQDQHGITEFYERSFDSQGDVLATLQWTIHPSQRSITQSPSPRPY
jgi:uncharacterized protein with NRDE domain